MRNAYLKVLQGLAERDERIYALVADNGAIVYDKYREEFPQRFINFGIAEANMISVAAGLASCGKIPFAYTISCFLTMRAYEQIRNDVCLQKMNVKLVGIGAGFVYGNLGPTHHAVEDIAIMRVLPGMTIISPADDRESAKATLAAYKNEGPVYLRLATGSAPDVYKSDYNFKLGKGVILKEGTDLAIIGTGGILADVMKVSAELEGSGLSTRVINIHTIKPIDKEIILGAASQTKAILTVEEHSTIGGLGSAVAEVMLEGSQSNIQFTRLGLDNKFPQGYGSYQEMKDMNGLSCEDIMREVLALIKGKTNNKELVLEA